MRCNLIIVFLLVFSSRLFSQELRRLRTTIGMGGGQGILIFAEPSYRINDRILLGLQIQGGFIDRNTMLITTSSSFFGQYYLSDKRIRPFLGLGLGSYSMKVSYVCDGSCFEYSSPNLGISTRLGFDFKHLSIYSEYSLIKNPNGSGFDSVYGNHFLLKAGFTFGGGRKKKFK